MRTYGDNRPPRASGVRIGPGSISPFIKVLLIANGVVFLLQALVGARFTAIFWLSPGAFFDQFPNYVYQVFTYMFLHGSFWHLLFNMFVLWMFGTEIEYVWGTRRFARFYILCGLAGGVLPLITHGLFAADPTPILGASGAIYGVLVAYWVMYPNRMLYLYFLFPIRVKWAIPGLMLLGFLFGGPGVAHMTHLGGALWGFAHLKWDWRWVYVGRRIQDLRYRRQAAKLNKKRHQAEDIMKRVDAILDKINEVGIDNISDEDRKFLQEASSELSRQKDRQKR
ncbi:MAG TPA: rhomboid family intramembrane serine protease [Acidobacteriota bacterium]|nr:rhomboid family intramembrane serine protease [Acidobacteriota bacterium]